MAGGAPRDRSGGGTCTGATLPGASFILCGSRIPGYEIIPASESRNQFPRGRTQRGKGQQSRLRCKSEAGPATRGRLPEGPGHSRSQAVSASGSWTEAAMASPVPLTAGTTYRVGAHLPQCMNGYYRNSGWPTTFANGTVGQNFYYSYGDMPHDGLRQPRGSVGGFEIPSRLHEPGTCQPDLLRRVCERRLEREHHGSPGRNQRRAQGRRRGRPRSVQ